MDIISQQELNNLSKAELKLELEKAQKEYIKKKVGVRTGHNKANHEIKKLKKYIAQMLTIMHNTADHQP